jgi:hypothetical protein
VPAEIRRILFVAHEILAALRDYHRRVGQPLPSGPVLACTPECDEAPTIDRYRIAFHHSDPPANDIVIPATTLAVALILYCRNRKIPLPAQAEKSVQLLNKQVCLVVTSSIKATENTAAPLCL